MLSLLAKRRSSESNDGRTLGARSLHSLLPWCLLWPTGFPPADRRRQDEQRESCAFELLLLFRPPGFRQRLLSRHLPSLHWIVGWKTLWTGIPPNVWPSQRCPIHARSRRAIGRQLLLRRSVTTCRQEEGAATPFYRPASLRQTSERKLYYCKLFLKSNYYRNR